MRWRKGKVINVTKGRDNLIREVELKVDQSNLNKTITTNIHLQHIVPIEITEEKQALKPITKFCLSVLLQKMQISRRLKRNIMQWHFCLQGECEEIYYVNMFSLANIQIARLLYIFSTCLYFLVAAKLLFRRDVLLPLMNSHLSLCKNNGFFRIMSQQYFCMIFLNFSFRKLAFLFSFSLWSYHSGPLQYIS